MALSLYTAAFVAEIVRAGILAISQGQTEAAAARGFEIVSHRLDIYIRCNVEDCPRRSSR